MENIEQKRIVAIHDISCAGRCSLTVALPIISCAGIEANIIPTALLSTHTGDFVGYTYKDLADEILPIARHWKTLGRSFNAIYTGYLGSFEQLHIMKELFCMFADEHCIRFVDPVMADHGVLYKNFDFKFVEGMTEFCRSADIITPNITEALFMLGDKYMEGPYTKDFVEDILIRMSEICPKVVVTGLDFDNNLFGAAAFDKDENIFEYALTEKIKGKYHGTGDVFASSLLAALLNDISLSGSLKLAVNFTVESIKRTRKMNSDVRYGVNFEEGLLDFMLQLRELADAGNS